MSTRSMIGRVEAGGRVRAVYCHWSGSPDINNNGGTLAMYWDDPGKLDRLLSMGSLSDLGYEIGEEHSPSDYSRVREWCSFHGRDWKRRGPEYEAIPYVSDRAYIEHAQRIDAEYAYLWTPDRGWLFVAIPWDVWGVRKDVIDGLEWQSVIAFLQKEVGQEADLLPDDMRAALDRAVEADRARQRGRGDYEL